MAGPGTTPRTERESAPRTERGSIPRAERESGQRTRRESAQLTDLRRARDRIDRDYAEPLTIDILAAEAHCSRYHFMRSFQAAYGEPPGLYLTRRRIERAKDLLRSANLTVTEICHLVGFASLGSFSRRFTELVGTSPSAYRAQAGTRAAAPIPGCFVLMWNKPTGPRTFREASAAEPD